MTSILLQYFNERSEEVSKYFIFLQDLEQEKIQLIIESKGNSKSKKIDTGLENTLRASAYLLLYNLIESTMKDAIEEIFSKLQNQGVSFDNLRPELQKIVLRNLKDKNPDKVLEKILDLSRDIITAGFDKEKLFSGNIDAKKIKEIAQEYGFSAKTKIDSSDLLKVKENRNELAHGIRPFGEVGKEITADKLMEIQNKVVEYLRQIIENIEKYLDNQEYLDSSTNNP